MSPLYPPLVEVGEDLFDKVIGVNLKGPFRLAAWSASAWPTVTAGRSSTSAASTRPTRRTTAYAAAKAGLNALTARSPTYGPTVRVNCIMPGPFLTDISKAWDMDAFQELAAAVPVAARRRAGRDHRRRAVPRLGGVELHHRRHPQDRRRRLGLVAVHVEVGLTMDVGLSVYDIAGAELVALGADGGAGGLLDAVAGRAHRAARQLRGRAPDDRLADQPFAPETDHRPGDEAARPAGRA